MEYSFRLLLQLLSPYKDKLFWYKMCTFSQIGHRWWSRWYCSCVFYEKRWARHTFQDIAGRKDSMRSIRWITRLVYSPIWFNYNLFCVRSHLHSILSSFLLPLPFIIGSISDKIFIACDNKVKAFNKKGKVFLTFTSSLTEPIKSMYVSGNDMILCGNHVYNHYRDCKDIGSYLCGDTIVDAVAICPNNVIKCKIVPLRI